MQTIDVNVHALIIYTLSQSIDIFLCTVIDA